MNQESLNSLSNKQDWREIRLIATDMDGTLTQEEKFNSNLLSTLARLAEVGVDVLIVTGRSAGWVQAIASYLPVVGAIAENGGLLYWHSTVKSQTLTNISDIEQHRQELSQVFKLIQQKFPQIIESEDNRFRLTDWTFDVTGLNQNQLEQIDAICQSKGYAFTYSTVQCHLKPLHQNKAITLNQVISQYLPNLKPEQIVTVGDSPNDESLFNSDDFPVSVGVANILKYRDRLQYLPAYVTSKSESEGFCELAELIINSF